MSAAQTVQLTSLHTFYVPFPYFTAVEAFGESVSSSLLDWLETRAPWRLVEADFYEQYECSLLDASLPREIEFLAAKPFLDDLRSKVERIFDTQLVDLIDCTAHKLLHGQRIRLHNDFIAGEETHRVLVQLNRGWSADQGGFLMFFNSREANDVHRVFSPTHNSVVGFAISEHSNHAVSTIYSGERFTLVFSFYERSEG